MKFGVSIKVWENYICTGMMWVVSTFWQTYMVISLHSLVYKFGDFVDYSSF